MQANHNVVVKFKKIEILPTLVLQGTRKSDRAWITLINYGELSVNISEASDYPMAISKYALYRELNNSWVEIASFSQQGNYTHIDNNYLKKNERARYKLSAIDIAGREVVTTFVEL